MSDRKWTPAQLAAIEDRGGTLLVSAAAGSGKTAVLVERAVRLLTDSMHPIAADRLLIVTFTRAAAEELRQRIAVRLAAESAANPGSTWLRRQKLLLGRASICTIDAYCMQLLRRYFNELNIPPDFTLADDATAYTLRQDALAQVLEACYEDADFCAFASLYGRARSDAAAAQAVLALYDFLRSLPFPRKALREICAAYHGAQPLCETAWGKALLENARAAVASAQRLAQAAKELVAREVELANYKPALDEDAAFLDALALYLEANRWDDAAVYVQNFRFAPFKPVRGYQSAGMDAVKALRDDVKMVVKQLRENIFICTQAEFAEDRARTAPMIEALARAVTCFEDAFYAAKLAEKCLEYSDFEHLALRLLAGEDGQKTPLAQSVSRDFDAVMVDEYQDTNALQALLYTCLANDDASNLFFVGDVKQSIYRFRLASPEIFIEKRESFAPYGHGIHPAAVVLGHNFRSAGNVIAQINDIFSCIMSRTVGDVDYNEEEMLYEGAPSSYDGGPLELRLVDTGDEGAACGDAQVVAQEIAHLVHTGFPVRIAGQGTRPCGWGDFCILLRSRAKFQTYAAALAAQGAPVFADTGESFLDAGEVAPLLALLRVVDNPGQDVALAAALLSPLFGFTPDDLTALRAHTPRGTLYAALLKSSAQKARAFCDVLTRLRAVAATACVEELCNEILQYTHYWPAVGAMENGAARRENLRAFIAYAAAVDAGGAGGLAGVLRSIDNALESGGMQSAQAPTPPPNTVSIMTIHRSKGLEFPICILADAARRFNLRDTASPVLFHPSLGMGLNLRAGEGGVYTTAPHRAIRFAQRAESVSEEMRILYVALTRARDKLIVTIPLQDPVKTLSTLATSLAGTGGADAYTLAGATSFSAWLCTAALLHPDCEELRKAAGGALLPLQEGKGRMCARIVPYTAQESAPTAQKVFLRTAPPDPTLLAALRGNFARAYDKAALCRLPAKLSVSAIAHASAQPVLARPAFLYREGMTAAERGTAMHSFLQFADFTAAAQDLEGELTRLVDAAYISADTARWLDKDKVRAFLRSRLAARMHRADQLLREYEFITAVPAARVAEMPPGLAATPVLVQGIADAVLLTGKHAEIVDYKTDAGKTPEAFLKAYTGQLLLYRGAVEKRLGVKVTACTIYALQEGLEIDVPLTAQT